jgi:hypothetical protein
MLVLLFAAFLGAFALTSPWLLDHFAFIREIYFRSDSAGGGEWFGFKWLDYLNSINFFGPTVGLLAAVGVGALAIAWARRKTDSPSLAFLWVLAFLVIFVTFLITKVNRVTVIYALPIVPLVALLAAFGLFALRQALSQWFKREAGALASVLVAMLVLVPHAAEGAKLLMQYPNLVTSLAPENRMFASWLVRCVPPETKILTASYSYAPPAFVNVVMAEGLSYFQSAQPDLVTLNMEDVARTDPADKQSNVGSYYDLILHGTEWRRGPVFGRFAVFLKAGAPSFETCH